MSPSLPAASGRAVVSALGRAGFRVRRIAGSHHVMEHPGPPVVQVIVPVHGGRDLPKGTLRAILRQSGLDLETFRELLR